MRQYEDYPDGYPIYTFVGDDGENVVIDAPALRDWCIETEPEIYDTPVQDNLLAQFIWDKAVREERVIEMLEARDEDSTAFTDPVIMVKTGTVTEGAPDVLLVDGHHRYALAIMEGATLIGCHVLVPEQWEPFRIHGMPTLTKDELRRAPPRGRRQ